MWGPESSGGGGDGADVARTRGEGTAPWCAEADCDPRSPPPPPPSPTSVCCSVSPFTPTPPPAPTPGTSSSNTGAIAGGVVGGVVGLILGTPPLTLNPKPRPIAAACMACGSERACPLVPAPSFATCSPLYARLCWLLLLQWRAALFTTASASRRALPPPPAPPVGPRRALCSAAMPRLLRRTAARGSRSPRLSRPKARCVWGGMGRVGTSGRAADSPASAAAGQRLSPALAPAHRCVLVPPPYLQISSAENPMFGSAAEEANAANPLYAGGGAGGEPMRLLWPAFPRSHPHITSHQPAVS